MRSDEGVDVERCGCSLDLGDALLDLPRDKSTHGKHSGQHDGKCHHKELSGKASPLPTSCPRGFANSHILEKVHGDDPLGPGPLPSHIGSGSRDPSNLEPSFRVGKYYPEEVEAYRIGWHV